MQRRIGIHPLDGFTLALLDPLLEAAPSWCGHVGRYAQVSKITQSGLQLRRCRPSTFFIELRQTELIGPNNRALVLPIVIRSKQVFVLVRVADTDHHRDHIGKVGVAPHRIAHISLYALKLLEQGITHWPRNFERL